MERQNDIALQVCYAIMSAAKRGDLASVDHKLGEQYDSQGNLLGYNGTETITVNIKDPNGATDTMKGMQQLEFNLENNVHGV